MLTPEKLESLLLTQFGPFIRENRYRDAFDRAMHGLKNLNPDTSQIDIFYLFMHRLILDLFNEMDKIEKQLQECKESH